MDMLGYDNLYDIKFWKTYDVELLSFGDYKMQLKYGDKIYNVNLLNMGKRIYPYLLKDEIDSKRINSNICGYDITKLHNVLNLVNFMKNNNKQFNKTIFNHHKSSNLNSLLYLESK